jgi:hypothetical protein
MTTTLEVGDHVTVETSALDPVEISVHRHAVIVSVEADGYMVGHPPAGRRFGPFPETRLTRGWETAR